MAIAAVGATIFLGNKLAEELGPEKAWPEIQSLLPFEDPPPGGLTAFRMPIGGMAKSVGRLFGQTEEELAAVGDANIFGLIRASDSVTFTFSLSSNPNYDLVPVPGEVTRVEMDLQGTTVTALRFTPASQTRDGQRLGIRTNNSVLVLDLGLRPPGFLKLLVQGSEGEVSVDDVQATLAPFDMWSTRILTSEPPPVLPGEPMPPTTGGSETGGSGSGGQ